MHKMLNLIKWNNNHYSPDPLEPTSKFEKTPSPRDLGQAEKNMFYRPSCSYAGYLKC